jgi:hypothetical protein
MAGVVRIPWYSTVFRSNKFADAVAEVAPLSLRYGATRYAVHRSRDDMYKIDQMMWFESKDDWYRYWDSPELIEFRARYMGKYQVPVVYVWHDEIAAGELGPQVEAAEPTLPSPDLGADGQDGSGPLTPNGGQPTPSPTTA